MVWVCKECYVWVSLIIGEYDWKVVSWPTVQLRTGWPELGPNGRKIGIYKWIWVRATIYVNRYNCKVCAKCRENWKHEREKEQGTEENTPELGDSTETLVLLSMLSRRVLSLSDRTWCPYFIRFLFCALCVFSLVCCVKRRIVQRLWFYYR
mgnify:FL=1